MGQGPGHSLGRDEFQLFGDKAPVDDSAPSNVGFVKSYVGNLRGDRVPSVTPDDIRAVMQSFRPDQLPALALAKNFVLCDHWFCEVPGPTMPNRSFMHAATSLGYAHNQWKHTFHARTIYDLLTEAGKTWAVYYSDDNEVAQFSPTNQHRSAFRIYEDTFVADAQNGKLPNYSFIVPRFADGGDGLPCTSMHAPNDVRPGDALVAEIYAALRSNRVAWEKTLLIVTFDEHGGFFDHVAPPGNAPNPDGIVSPAPDDHTSWAPAFAFDRLGLRVPTLLVSPWMPAGVVHKAELRHTSILSTVRELFDLGGPLTKRDENAPTFLDLLNRLGAPRGDTPATLPKPAEDAVRAAIADKGPPGGQPLDDVLEERVDSWAAFARAHGDRSIVAQSKPATRKEAHDFAAHKVGKLLDDAFTTPAGLRRSTRGNKIRGRSAARTAGRFSAVPSRISRIRPLRPSSKERSPRPTITLREPTVFVIGRAPTPSVALPTFGAHSSEVIARGTRPSSAMFSPWCSTKASISTHTMIAKL